MTNEIDIYKEKKYIECSFIKGLASCCNLEKSSILLGRIFLLQKYKTTAYDGKSRLSPTDYGRQEWK